MRDCANHEGRPSPAGRRTTDGSPSDLYREGDWHGEGGRPAEAVADADADALVRNWRRIADPEKRRALFDLIEAVAASQDLVDGESPAVEPREGAPAHQDRTL